MMANVKTLAFRFTFPMVISLSVMIATAFGQDQSQSQSDDVLRVNTELVQTNVMVFDKQGQFVDGLKKDQFELRVDGKPMPISFFERIFAGSPREEALRAGVPGGAASSSANVADSTVRGRTIIFFIDDNHLSPRSIENTRKMILKFIEESMGPNDQIQIASTSGHIGFLQQFADNKVVLNAALARVTYRPSPIINGATIVGAPMTEYMALTIEKKSDLAVFGWYVGQCLLATSTKKLGSRDTGAARLGCEAQVRNSARQILLQTSAITNETYDSLEAVVRSSARAPGRKLAFVISDGFLLDTGPRSQEPGYKLKRITDAAQRAGVVIYTIDAKGLVSGMADATGTIPMDPNGALQSASLREVVATQDALNALASDTGGRALRNQNYYDKFVTDVVQETSRYYVLAWRPENEEQKGEKFRAVEVKVMGHPELTVRLPRGSFNVAPAAPVVEAKGSKGEAKPTNAVVTVKPADNELRSALTDFSSRGALPTVLSLNYLDTPVNGMVLTASMQVAMAPLSYTAPDGNPVPANVDIAGLVLNDQGKAAASFKNSLTVAPPAENASSARGAGVIYNYRSPLKPGIYQVRVAARDSRSGIVGSSLQWVVIPDLSGGRLALSTLLIGGQVVGAMAKKDVPPDLAAPQVQFSVDHHFRRTSHLNFWLFIYNAARGSQGASQPNLTAQVQVFRNSGQSVVTTQPRKLALDASTDMARIPYGGDFQLDSLPPGQYVIQVTITDQLTNTKAVQRAKFSVE